MLRRPSVAWEGMGEIRAAPNEFNRPVLDSPIDKTWRDFVRKEIVAILCFPPLLDIASVAKERGGIAIVIHCCMRRLEQAREVAHVGSFEEVLNAVRKRREVILDADQWLSYETPLRSEMYSFLLGLIFLYTPTALNLTLILISNFLRLLQTRRLSV